MKVKSLPANLRNTELAGLALYVAKTNTVYVDPGLGLDALTEMIAKMLRHLEIPMNRRAVRSMVTRFLLEDETAEPCETARVIELVGEVFDGWEDAEAAT